VRSRLLLLVVTPTLAAVVLGGIGVTSSVRSAIAYQRVEQLSKLGAAVSNLVQALQNERQDTIKYIVLGQSGGGRDATPEAAAPELAVLTLDHKRANQIANQVRALAKGIGSAYPGLARQEAQGALTSINGLTALRDVAITSQIPALVVTNQYDATIDQLLTLENEMAAGSNDAALADNVRALGLVSGMKEQVSRQQAILTSSLASPDLIGSNGIAPAQLAALNAAQAEQGADLAQFNLTASTSEHALFNSALASTQASRAQAQVDQAIAQATATGAAPSANPVFTNAANGASYLVSSFRTVEQRLVSSILARSNSLRTKAIALAIVEGLVVTAVLVLALFLTTIVGRSMIRPLTRLRHGALEVAGVRLPETVRRMSEAEGEDLRLDVKPIDVDSTDEIGEVARAFDQVHREAVRLAANEAALRGNVNAMFVNLSRRSQSLVERQIRLIDDLEQGEQDPERLSSLFQMDHLATRMRRNSENLLVLAGHDVSRRWTQAVALVDVLRAAVSEIEQYERVTLNVQPGISVRGHAVNDVVHLLSELVENATSFSAAETPVTVSGHLLNSGGVLLDISDQGVGMDAEEMAHANWRLDNPPVVDVAVSRRMGLFVVARLAARHGIRVRLRPASMGGLTALVWLPDEVVSYETTPAAPGLRRFEIPAQASPPDPAGAGSRLADWPVGGLTEERSTTAAEVLATQAPRFTPLRPDLSDTAAFSAIGPDTADPATTAPEAATADAGAGPGAAADTDVASVFSAPVNTAETRPAERMAEFSPSSFGMEQGQGNHEVIVPPAAGGVEENRLPIFESVESDWFRRGRHGAERTGQAVTPTPVAVTDTDWTSPADEGWRAAEVAHAPVSGGVTHAGLPKRVPKANLVPGGVGAAAATPSATPARSATQARERLASFQRGIREARAAGRDEIPDGKDDSAS
jgi:signal transduction histidine kinase